jgi:aspartate/methionine/tyrosine aminotransferase
MCSSNYIYHMFLAYKTVSGWRLGWMIVPEELIKSINVLQQNMFINAPTISQVAALQCWNDETIAELEQHVTKYKCSRQYILDSLLKIPEINQQSIAPADGGFYIYIDLGIHNVALPEYGSVRMCQLLLEEKFVAMTPGTDFEDPDTDLGNRRFRISYAGGIETVQDSMKRFIEFFPTWVERVVAVKVLENIYRHQL